MLQQIKRKLCQDVYAQEAKTAEHNKLLETEISSFKEMINGLTNKIDSLNKEIDDLKNTNTKLEEQLNEHSHSESEPWVQVVGEGADPSKGIKIQLDWNDAFIEYLKGQGIKGVTEDTAVQRWLAMVNIHLIESLEDKAVQGTTKGTINDITEEA